LLQALDALDFAGRIVLASSMVVYGEGAYRCGIHGSVRPLPRTKDQLERGRFEPGCPVCGADLQPQPITEELAVDPRSLYAATKLHQEHLCTIYGRTHSAPVAFLRYHNVYGPRMPRDTPYAGVASIFLSALRAGRRPRIFEDGNQMRDFIHVRDIARANVLALTRREPPTGAFNISTGHPRSVSDLAVALAASIGESALPDISGEFRLADVRHVFASPARARRELGFVAEVELDEGMRMLAASSMAAALSDST
jgi:dTDP-L-rhamnose 4-epimerase